MDGVRQLAHVINDSGEQRKKCTSSSQLKFEAISDTEQPESHDLPTISELNNICRG